jgi:hypothetical protein
MLTAERPAFKRESRSDSVTYVPAMRARGVCGVDRAEIGW